MHAIKCKNSSTRVPMADYTFSTYFILLPPSRSRHAMSILTLLLIAFILAIRLRHAHAQGYGSKNNQSTTQCGQQFENPDCIVQIWGFYEDINQYECLANSALKVSVRSITSSKNKMEITCTSLNKLKVDVIFETGIPTLYDSRIQYQKLGQGYRVIIRPDYNAKRGVKYIVKSAVHTEAEAETSVLILYAPEDGGMIPQVYWMPNNLEDNPLDGGGWRLNIVANQESVLIPCLPLDRNMKMLVFVQDNPITESMPTDGTSESLSTDGTSEGFSTDDTTESLLTDGTTESFPTGRSEQTDSTLTTETSGDGWFAVPVDNFTLTYDQLHGFWLNTSNFPDYASTNFRCGPATPVTNERSFVYFTISDLTNDLVVVPTYKAVAYYVHQDTNDVGNLRIECGYNEPITIEGKIYFNNGTEAFISIPGNTTSILPIKRYTAKFSGENFGKLIAGDVLMLECLNDDNEILHEWEVTLYDIETSSALKLERDNSGNNFYCSSEEFENARLNYTFCDTPAQCLLIQHCILMGKNHRCRRYTQMYQGWSSMCQGENKDDAESLLSCEGAQIFGSGIVTCSAGNDTFTQLRFQGLDGSQYYYKQTGIPSSALVSLQTNSTEILAEDGSMLLETNTKYYFECRAHRFYSEGEIQWSLESNENSLVQFHPDIAEIIAEETFFTDELLIAKINVIFMSTEIQKLICSAPEWDSEEWVQSNINFSVTESNFITFLLIGVVATTVVIVVAIIFIIVRRNRKNRIKLDKTEVANFLYGTPTQEQDVDDSSSMAMIPTDQLPYVTKFEIPKECLIIDKSKLLGSGEFGEVYFGQYYQHSAHAYGNSRSRSRFNKAVAIKIPKSNCPSDLFKTLLSELKIMTYLGEHENVVRLVGAYTREIRKGVLLIAIEFCQQGSLESYILKNKGQFGNNRSFPKLNPVPSRGYHCIEAFPFFVFGHRELLKWSYEISAGMEFLFSRNIIHGDLATRNVLLNEARVAKIGDFGLSRRLYRYTQYTKKTAGVALPWRWMAVESLTSATFSTQSDVWSFGITLWEIFSLGNLPYPGLEWDINFGNRLKDGLRNLRPDHASTEIYQIMIECWRLHPETRPNFTTLRKYFLALVNQNNNNTDEQIRNYV